MNEPNAAPAVARYRLWLALMLIAAAILRAALVDAQSMTMDEVKDLAMARGGWATISGTENRFPPLYHLLLCGWLKAAPWDATGRGLSVLCGVLTVAAIAALGRTIDGDRAGLWAGAIAAAAPFAIWYATETRVYALYLLLGAVAIWQFTAACIDDRPRHWAGFAGAAVAGVYSHYYFGQLIVAAGLFWLGAKPQALASRKRGLIAFGMVGVACLPVAVMLLGDLDQAWGYAQTSKFGATALGYTYFSLLSGYTLGPGIRELHEISPIRAMTAGMPWVLGLGAATLVLLAAAIRTRGDKQVAAIRWALWFTAFCLAPPIVIGVVSRLAGFGYSPRHIAWIFAPLAALLGVGLARSWPHVTGLAAAAMIAWGFCTAEVNRTTLAEHQNEDARSVAAAIRSADGEEHTPVFALSGYMRDPLDYYLPDAWSVYWLPDVAFPAKDKPVTQQALDMIRDETPKNGNFWLAYSRPFHGDPEGSILTAIEEEFELKEKARFAGFLLYRGQRR